MKDLQDYINEELILEYIIGKNEENKVKFDLTTHSDDRKSNRNNQNNRFTPNYEISYTLYKVSKQIREDFDVNIINIKDIIGICDKSRNVNFNLVAEVTVKDEFIIYIKNYNS